jgi:signal transduction histidine kinase
MIEGLELIAESRVRTEVDANPAGAIQNALDRLEEAPDSVNCRSDRWRGVRGRHLSRIVFELLDNAFRHGQRPITVEATRRGGLGVLRVSDAGGAEIPPQLFEAFSQGDMSATREHGGLGIGLFVATRLCEADGGRLIVERRNDLTVAEVVYEIGG